MYMFKEYNYIVSLMHGITKSPRHLYAYITINMAFCNIHMGDLPGMYTGSQTDRAYISDNSRAYITTNT